LEKKNNFWSNNSKKTLLAILISMMWISTIIPIVLADETYIGVSFKPSGNVVIDVEPKIWNCSSIQGGAWYNSTNNYFTLYNNGTIAMTTLFKTNGSTDGAIMTYDSAFTIPVPNNQYIFNTSGFAAGKNRWIPTDYTGVSYATVNAGASTTFGLNINLGYLTTNYSWQKTTIYIQGSSI
jgi:hypothetical protein